jgi:hypothetical protein
MGVTRRELLKNAAFVSGARGSAYRGPRAENCSHKMFL